MARFLPIPSRNLPGARGRCPGPPVLPCGRRLTLALSRPPPAPRGRHRTPTPATWNDQKPARVMHPRARWTRTRPWPGPCSSRRWTASTRPARTTAPSWTRRATRTRKRPRAVRPARRSRRTWRGSWPPFKQSSDPAGWTAAARRSSSPSCRPCSPAVCSSRARCASPTTVLRSSPGCRRPEPTATHRQRERRPSSVDQQRSTVMACTARNACGSSCVRTPLRASARPRRSTSRSAPCVSATSTSCCRTTGPRARTSTCAPRAGCARSSLRRRRPVSLGTARLRRRSGRSRRQPTRSRSAS
jgi:hypothetical protein